MCIDNHAWIKDLSFYQYDKNSEIDLFKKLEYLNLRPGKEQTKELENSKRAREVIKLSEEDY
jgi:hypothetical protein